MRNWILRMINGMSTPTAPVGETLGQRNAAAATAVNNTNTVIAYLKGLMNRTQERISVNAVVQRGVTTLNLPIFGVGTPPPPVNVHVSLSNAPLTTTRVTFNQTVISGGTLTNINVRSIMAGNGFRLFGNRTQESNATATIEWNTFTYV